MKKFDNLSLCTIYSISLLCLSADLNADDGSMPSDVHHNNALSAIAFPLNQDQAWYTEETLLVWRPYLEDVDWATRSKTETQIGTDSFGDEFFTNETLKGNIKKPEFDWGTGVRIGIGRYLPHDLWDVSLFGTYFYGQADGKSNLDPTGNASLGDPWLFDFPELPFYQSSVDWRLNFFTVDLSFGREFYMLSTLTAHPFFGLRGAAIYQIYKTTAAASFIFETGATAPDAINYIQTFKANDRFTGIGPRAGADFTFNFGKSWALTGSFAAAIFYGHYEVKEKAILDAAETSPTFRLASRDYRTKDANYDVRSQIEGTLGLAAESWVNNHTVRIVPSVVFQASTWFAMNDLYRLSHVRTSVPNSQFELTNSTRNNGDLSFIGVNINLHIDF